MMVSSSNKMTSLCYFYSFHVKIVHISNLEVGGECFHGDSCKIALRGVLIKL